MKKIKYSYQIAILSMAFAFVSCDSWFEIYPKSETVLEDFWKDEGDVKSMVGSCYRGMNDTEFIERMVVWGEVRSDNVIKGKFPSSDISNILNANVTASNPFTSWGAFYKVINYCNTVLHFAPGVRAKDPNFTEGQLRAYLAEVKGIRALCYFTLLRTFRDIPLITEPIADDTAPFEVAQTSPDKVLDFLIKDLQDAENSAGSGGDNIQHTKGRITQNAIRALLADMYLWKNDYNNCITYCNKIINDNVAGLTLEASAVYNSKVFCEGNSKESIFELQFNTGIIPNYTVYEMYGMGYGYIRGGKTPFQLAALDFTITPLFGLRDLRGKDAFFPNVNAQIFPITKYTSKRMETSAPTVKETDYYFNETANWIFYKLSDIYLMKAEALVEIGSDLQGALDMVSLSYDRANPDLGAGTLQLSSYNSQSLMRELVFDERQRELMFEGKRYFDLLRRINREGTAVNVVNAYLMRKYKSQDQATVRSKLTDISALYMPVNKDELKQNTLLVQNPFYATSSDIDRK